ncbi:MAG: SIS domain-containing protein [Planctomycetes bacterium]|nr:SIS domain-containing protein [Planctomycetota bacterium]
MDFAKALQIVTKDIHGALGSMDPAAMEALADLVVKARRTVVAGQGRSGLIARAFAMRLTHLGISAHVAGEVTTTAVGRGDLLVAISGSGSTGITCHIAKKARAAGAATACLTGSRGARLSRMSDLVVFVPGLPTAKSRRPPQRTTAQFGGTLFEQCSLILLDALCLLLMERLKQSRSKMLSRHSNLE